MMAGERASGTVFLQNPLSTALVKVGLFGHQEKRMSRKGGETEQRLLLRQCGMGREKKTSILLRRRSTSPVASKASVNWS